MNKKSSHIASISLGVMSVGFATSLLLQEEGGTFGHLMLEGFEAGLVGGLADWFAVTALFRHPLGIPIPHTALLPKNRERVTMALVSAIENELLNKESILAKISQISLGSYIVEHVEKEIEKPGFQSAIVTLGDHFIREMDTTQLSRLLEREIKAYLDSLELYPLLVQGINGLMKQGYDEKAFDYILHRTEDWVRKPETRSSIGKIAMGAFEKLELNGLMQFALNAFLGYLSEDKLGGILQNLLLSTIGDLHSAGHPKRERILTVIRTELENLGQNEKLQLELERWKQQWVAQLELGDMLNKSITDVKERILKFIQQEDFGPRILTPMISKQLNRLKASPEWMDSFDSWLQSQIVQLIEEHHLKIGKLVKENLDKLDNETLTEMMEQKIGTDIQWIRVNGAVCGFLIGLVLGGIKLWM